MRKGLGGVVLGLTGDGGVPFHKQLLGKVSSHLSHVFIFYFRKKKKTSVVTVYTEYLILKYCFEPQCSPCCVVSQENTCPPR